MFVREPRLHDRKLRLAATLARQTDATMQMVAPAQQAGRSQPQTTVEPPGGPFVRHTQPGRRLIYQSPANAFGQLVQQPFVAVPGYISRIRGKIIASGGASLSTTSVAAAADSPYSTVSLITLRDPFGTVLMTGDGYSILHLVGKWSGCFFVGNGADQSNLPSWVAMSTGTSGTGNFTFAFCLPLELAKAYGVVSGANAALLPTLQIQLAANTSVYTTVPSTAPTVEVDIETDFYWLPQGVDVAPPGLGTTQQWTLQPCYPGIGSGASQQINIPRLGGYLSTLIFIMRDSNNARIDAWPTRLRWYVDGVPLYDTLLTTLYDDIYGQSWGLTRETGVIVFSRKTSLSQMNLGLFDTGEHFLSSSPGTAMQLEGMPWATIANAPATVQALFGQVVPAGTLIQGLPEV